MDGCRRARPQILVAGWAPKNLTLGDIHRTSDLSAVDRTRADNVPCTSRVRTIIDLAALLDAKALTRLVEDEVLTGRVDINELANRFAGLSRRGRRGIRRLRPVIEAHMPDANAR